MYGLIFNKVTIGILVFTLWTAGSFGVGYKTARDACQEEKVRAELVEYQKKYKLSQEASERATALSKELEKTNEELKQKYDIFIASLEGNSCTLSPGDAERLRKL